MDINLKLTKEFYNMNNIEYENDIITSYHRSKLSITKNDESFKRFVEYYGLRFNNEAAINNYMKRGLYSTIKPLYGIQRYNIHYGDWIFKLLININNHFIIDDKLYNYFHKSDLTPLELISLQFDKYNISFTDRNLSNEMFYDNYTYKIYRILEPYLMKLKHDNKISGVLTYQFNYNDETDISKNKNKMIDDFQMVTYDLSKVKIIGYKWASDHSKYTPIIMNPFNIKCNNYFNFENQEYLTEKFLKSNFKLKDFETKNNFLYDITFTSSYLEKQKIQEKIIKFKLSDDEILFFYKLIPIKFKIKEFNKNLIFLEDRIKNIDKNILENYTV